MLNALLDFLIVLGILINVDEFTLGTIQKIWGMCVGVSLKVFIGKKVNYA
jgi:hypothetical protein